MQNIATMMPTASRTIRFTCFISVRFVDTKVAVTVGEMLILKQVGFIKFTANRKSQLTLAPI
jgi:hypothetical protein